MNRDRWADGPPFVVQSTSEPKYGAQALCSNMLTIPLSRQTVATAREVAMLVHGKEAV
jgi:hypothetical protein